MHNIVPLLIAISLTLVTSTSELEQEDHLVQPETSVGVLGVLKDFYHNPEKYFLYLKLFYIICFDYLKRLREIAVSKEHKIMNRLRRYGSKNDKASFWILGAPLDRQVEQRVMAIIEVISDHMAEFLPTESELPDLDYKLPLVYFCGGLGKTYNLKSIKRRTTILKTDEKQDSLDIQILFHFNDMHVYYERFLERNSALRIRKGTLRMDFDDNEVSLHLTVPSISTVLDRVFKMECIFNVVSIKLVSLRKPNVNLQTNGLLKGHFTKFIAKEGMRLMMPTILDSLNESIEELIMDSLNTSGWWVCRNERRHAKLPEVPYTKYFHKYCGDDDIW